MPSLPTISLQKLCCKGIVFSFYFFITVGFRNPPWPWHAWRNFGFVTLPWGPWHAQNFVRCGSILSHSINIYSEISSGSQPPGQKLDINGYKSRKIPHTGCVTFRPFVRTSPWPVTRAKFRHVRYPPWPVTDELIETLVWCATGPKNFCIKCLKHV